MNFWPFKRKSPPPDRRVWNEDWRVGDTAECVVAFDDWHPVVAPWHRPSLKQRFIVAGFREAIGEGGCLRYYLQLEGWPVNLPTTAFRKVRPAPTEKSEIVERILKATPGKDRVRERA